MQGECGFFEWKDEKFTSWSVEVINGLRAEMIRLDNDVLECRAYGCQRCRGKINFLENEIENMQKMISEATSEAQKNKKKIRFLCILLVVAMIIISFLIGCKA